VPANNAGFKLRAPSGEEFDITGPFRIGRDEDCEIKVENSLASRIHASIWVDHGQLLVRDERSRNGTYVNGRRLPPGAAHRLYDGDRVQIVGATYIAITPAPDMEPPKTAPPTPAFAAQNPRQSAMPQPALLAALGCALLIVLVLCVSGGCFAASRVQTLLAPAATAIPSSTANTSVATVPAQATPTPAASRAAVDKTADAASTLMQSVANTQQAIETAQAATQNAAAVAATTEAAALTATAQGDTIFTLSGTFDLRQNDSGCKFADIPFTTGTLTLNVDFNAGTASLHLAGGGGGVRTGLRCGDSTGNMTWQQDYSSDLTGTLDPATGALKLDGLFIGQNDIFWHDCRLNGQPDNCPTGYSDTYSITAYLTGTVDSTSHTANGTWYVTPISLPTSGTWSAGQ
jgi:hypothetical protein